MLLLPPSSQPHLGIIATIGDPKDNENSEKVRALRSRASHLDGCLRPGYTATRGRRIGARQSALIYPRRPAEVLQSPQGEKPLILNVGPWLLYRQAHIPDAEYVGAGSDKQALETVAREGEAAAAQ